MVSAIFLLGKKQTNIFQVCSRAKGESSGSGRRWKEGSMTVQVTFLIPSFGFFRAFLSQRKDCDSGLRQADERSNIIHTLSLRDIESFAEQLGDVISLMSTP